MTRWQWHLQRAVAALGVPGLLGLAMLAAAVLMQFLVLQPAEREILALQERVTEARHAPPAAPVLAPEQQLARFYRFFPAQQAWSGQLRTLHRVTGGQELFMGKVDYKLSRVTGTPLKRYEVAYSLITDYPSLRVYLAEVLRALPNAALEDIELQRFSDGSEMLEAKLRLALYYRDGT